MQGNVVALTDEDGDVVEKFEYDVYGSSGFARHTLSFPVPSEKVVMGVPIDEEPPEQSRPDSRQSYDTIECLLRVKKQHRRD